MKYLPLLAVLLSPALNANTLIWDFEGRINVENNPVQDRLYDQNGELKFHLEENPDEDSFDRGNEGVPTNPVQYAEISDQASITDTPGDTPSNEWLLRSDWNLQGNSHQKHGDSDTGALTSDCFQIDSSSSFTFDLGGGSSPNGIFLHDADSGDVIISEHRDGGFLEARDWTTSELNGAGVSGAREVYLRIVDGTTGGWGHVTVDNIVANNAFLPQVPVINTFSASATAVSPGTPVTLTWDVTDPVGPGTNLAIFPEVGALTELSSSTQVTPTETTTYTLIAENLNGDTSREITILVDQTPIVNTFNLSNTTIREGDSTNLNWLVTGADSITIDHSIGDVTGSNTTLISPTTDTTYTLTATNSAGETTAMVTLSIDRTPLINSFTSSANNLDTPSLITLSWDIEDADTLEINQGLGTVTGTSTTDTPATSRTYSLTATNAFGTSTANVSVTVGETLTISEFLAKNDTGLTDERGDRWDWIEILNTTAGTINLEGWQLQDSEDIWTFPARELASGQSLIVFASDKTDLPEDSTELHANFKLSRAGEYLGLIRPDGTVAREYAPYPRQEGDVSYGLFGAPFEVGYFDPPTPNSPNGEGFDGFVEDTKFSINRGIFSNISFDVVITTDTSDAVIRYTTDGSEPTADTGTEYNTPVSISSTTTLRAAAFKDGFAPTNTDTQTYLFPEDVKLQPEMDTDIVNDAAYAASIESDLKSIPSLSLVLPHDSLFHATTGIYTNPENRGINWERATSIELLTQDGAETFQIDGGLRIHGADARRHLKKPFRLYFRSEYGEGKLRFPLYQGDVQEFDRLVLRGGGHEAWTSPYGSGVGAQAHSATYLRDAFLRQTHGEMGNLSPRGRFIHLYLNGIYWGLYNLHERADDGFGEAHLGGEKEDYDVIKTEGDVLAGTKDDWNDMQALTSSLTNTANYENMLTYLDDQSFIDNMILRIWSGDTDWLRSENELALVGNRNKNWYCLRKTRNRTSDDQWQFFVWDGELSMGKGHRDNRNLDFNISDVDIADSPGRIYSRIRRNSTFRTKFGDRLYKLIREGGHMSKTVNQARWSALTSKTRNAVVAESARWGDAIRSAPYTRDGEWQEEVDWVHDEFLTEREDIVVSQFQRLRLYPRVDAPEFLSTTGNLVNFADPEDEDELIYYTLDGSDPMDSDTVYTTPFTLAQSTHVKARIKDGSSWSPLNDNIFHTGNLAVAGNLIVSEIMYHPMQEGDEDLEFIEVLNPTNSTVDLSSVSFSSGIEFTFPVGTLLSPGASILIVKNQTAFEAEYGTGLPIAGEFENQTGLQNDGERLTLLAYDGSTIESFRYEQDMGWPVIADGIGHSIVRNITSPLNDPAEATSWIASADLGGSPGNRIFTGIPHDDRDLDQIPDLLEYALGTSDEEFTNLSHYLFIEPQESDLVVTVRYSLTADFTALSLLSSSTLEGEFESIPLDLSQAIPNNDGTANISITTSRENTQKEFWRLHVTQ